jgi:hypothetical protein
MSLTFQEFARYASSPDGRDTTENLSDSELGRAIAETGNLLSAAAKLSEERGYIVARENIADRVEASPVLQRILEVARVARMEQAVAAARQRIAEERHLRALKRQRREAPRCGARRRDGGTCQRPPELGKSVCAQHGGASPVIGPGRRRTRRT